MISIGHLNSPKKDLVSRFDDVLSMEICDWMISLFTADVNEADVDCQEELLEIRHEGESKTNFDSGSYVQLWQNQKMPNPYPNTCKIIFELLITFPTSHLVEAGFSAVNKILTKRNALEIYERGDIGLMLTKIEPNNLI